MDRQGKLIVLEGSDGSGKTTQFNLLLERLKATGYDVAVYDFPRYEKSSSYFVKQYLNGKYGPAENISPYTASLFYALDRYEAGRDIKKSLSEGKLVLINRYVGSNMAHQGSKFEDPVEQRGFFVWEDNLEFHLLKVPRPDINIFLRVPAELSYELISQKAQRDYTNNIRDEHEANLKHLKKTVSTYDLLCQLFPKDFVAIECTKAEKLMSVPEISNLIWDKLKPLLPVNKPHLGHSAVVTLSNSSSAPKATDDERPDKLTQEFKNASLLLKSQVEKHVKSIDPPGFTIWSDNGYQFYTPQGLGKDVEALYKSTNQRLAQLHQQMRAKLEAYYEKRLLNPSQNQVSPPNISTLLLPATPLSAISDFRVTLSEKSLNRVSRDLLAGDSPELQWAAKQLYVAARQKWPESFRAPLETNDGPEQLNSIIAKLAEERFSLNSSDTDSVKLLEALPRQEFDLLADSIYPYSNLSLDEITEEVSDWSYSQKYESLKQAAADPALILEKIHYKFDVVSDQVVLSQIANNTLISNIQTQSASPRNGYEVPEILEEAGIEDLFMECFDESLKLFSVLQQAGREELCVYATLLGHKLRWQLSVNAQDMKAILQFHGDSTYSKITGAIRELISETHPLAWEVLSGISSNRAGSQPKRNRVKLSKRRPVKPKNRRDK